MPDQKWVSDFRSTLLMQTKNTVVSNEPRSFALFKNIGDVLSFVMPAEQLRFAVRTAAVLVVAFGVAFGGSITTVSAALNSIPGDLLYPLKKMTEGAQVRFAADDAAKAELHVEFAGRRVQEVAKINEVEDSGNTEKIAVAVEGFKQEMDTVNQYMDQSQPEVAVQIAKMVDAKNGEHEQILTKVAQTTADPEAKDIVQQAKVVAEDTGVKAVEVMVVTHTAASTTVTTADVKNSVESKIVEIEKRVEQLTENMSATSTPGKAAEDAKTSIDEARSLSSSGDFASALTKIKESTELVRTVTALTAVVVGQVNTSTPAIISASSTLQIAPRTTQSSGVQNTSTPMLIQSLEENVGENSSTPRIVQP